MALTPSNLLTRVSDTLQDSNNTRWTQAELIRYLNDARRELAIYRPDIYAETASIALTAGSKQSIPSDGNKFLDGIRNYTSADVVGRSVRLVERELLDSQSPDWHTSTTSTTIKNFMFDERNPKVFYVYPPATGGGHKLEILYSKSPVEITTGDLSSTTVLAKEDLYTNVIIDYILYKALSKDSEYAGNMQRATLHYQAFANAVGIGKRQKYVSSPNVSNVGGQIPKEAGADN